MKKSIFFVVLVIFFTIASIFGFTKAQTPENSWPMAAANPQRTSYTSEEVTGKLYASWYKPIEPFVSTKIQPIIANDTIYVSTAKGLYAFSTDDGSQRWVYPTEMPLGNSPTIVNGVLYVPGLDHKIHALNSSDGQLLWSYEAEGDNSQPGAGFQTNPLVINNIVYAGNRDGYMYAIYSNDHAQKGTLAWRFKTEGPILFSAAASTDNSTIYFASNDSYAYALNSLNGNQVWRTKLPSGGFQSWWPVVTTNKVIFTAVNHYRPNTPPENIEIGLFGLDRSGVYPNRSTNPVGTPVCSSSALQSNGSIDASCITQYLSNNPQRRTYYVLNSSTGAEITPYAPILWAHAPSGNRYPPAVDPNTGILYQKNSYMSQEWIPGGNVSGWIPDTNFITTPSEFWVAVDEPQAWSIGGNTLYWIHFGSMGSFNITASDSNEWWPNVNSSKEWIHFDQQANVENLPWFNSRYDSVSETFGPQNGNGVYVYNDFSPPVPYKGKVYLIHYNSLISFTTTSTPSPAALPMATSVNAQNQSITTPSQTTLKAKLEDEVQKIVNAGHLRPGYINHGLFTDQAIKTCMDYGQDYFHDTSDTIYSLYRAYPYLSSSLQSQVISYLDSEIANYAPYDYSHIGWATGAKREVFDLPPEVEQSRASFPASFYRSYDFIGWGEGNGYGGRNIPPHMFYAMWKYAQLKNYNQSQAKTLFDSISTLMSNTPADSVLSEYPFVHNSYITGLIGFVELGKLSGYLESSPQLSGRITELNRLLSLRASTFTKNIPPGGYSGGQSLSSDYCRTINSSRNFIFLLSDPNDAVSDLSSYLKQNALTKVQEALDEYTFLTPYWFLGKYENSNGENSIQPLYETAGLFQAKAQIIQDSKEELFKYLDVPAFATGDLVYINNLVSVIEASGSEETTPTPTPTPTPYVSPTATPTPTTTTSPNNLLIAYSFDEGTGLTANDSSGNNYNATINGASWTSLGKYGNALSFDGINDSAVSPNITLGQNFTYMAWVNNPSNQTYETIMTTGSNRDLYLSGSVISFYNGSNDISFTSQVTNNNWNHVALVYNGISLTAYLNGMPADSVNMSLSSISNVLQVGAWIYNGSNTDFFSGLIDEVRVYNTILNQEQIQTLMNTPINSVGEPQPTLTPTPTPTSTPAPQPTNTPTPTPTISGSSLQFDGNDFARLTNIPLSTVFTYEAWIKRTADTGTYEVFLADATSNYSQAMFVLYIDGGNQDCGIGDQFAYYQKRGDSTHCSGITADLNKWYHVSVTRASNGTRRFFINGVLVNTQLNTVAPTDSNGRVNIGRAGDSNSEYFKGIIDEVRISNAPLYTSNFTPPTSTLPALTSTVALYHLNEGAGQIIYDASPNGRNGTLGTNTSLENSDPGWSTDSPITAN